MKEVLFQSKLSDIIKKRMENVRLSPLVITIFFDELMVEIVLIRIFLNILHFLLIKKIT